MKCNDTKSHSSVGDLIRQGIPRVNPYVGTKQIMNELLAHSALAVQDEKQIFFGVITPYDVLINPHILVIDCITPKRSIQFESAIEIAFNLMLAEKTDVLPVFKGDTFAGVVFKEDLGLFIWQRQNNNNTIKNKSIEVKGPFINIIKSFLNDSQYPAFLVAPDRTILFLNSKAIQAWSHTIPEIKEGEILNFSSTNFKCKGLILSEPAFNKALSKEYSVEEKETEIEGKLFWTKIEYRPLCQGEEAIAVAIIANDVTEEKRRNAQIVKQSELLRQISWIQSHKVRQPVASILGLTSLINIYQLTSESREIIALLQKSAYALDEIIRDIVTQANRCIQENEQGDIAVDSNSTNSVKRISHI